VKYFVLFILYNYGFRVYIIIKLLQINKIIFYFFLFNHIIYGFLVFFHLVIFYMKEKTNTKKSTFVKTKETGGASLIH